MLWENERLLDDSVWLAERAKAAGVDVTLKVYLYPAALLSDNAAVFSGASRKGKVLLETELARLGIGAKHATPYHPQTCGKVERFHQSQRRFLAKQAPAQSLAHLQLQLDSFAAHGVHYRVRHDRVDTNGTVTLRYQSGC